MLDPARFTRIYDLHQRGYALLQWINTQLQRGTLDFEGVHENLNPVDAAAAWIERNLANLPERCRPSRAELREFASLFASFVRTSFELSPDTRIEKVSSCGCWCDMCTYLVRAPLLKLRRVGKGAAKDAKYLEVLYLEEALGTGADGSAIRAFVDDPGDGAADLAMATWGRELLRRAEFASQGDGVLVLWRTFAWTNGNPTRGFTLAATDVLAAEQRLLARFNAAGAGTD